MTKIVISATGTTNRSSSRHFMVVLLVALAIITWVPARPLFLIRQANVSGTRWWQRS